MWGQIHRMSASSKKKKTYKDGFDTLGFTNCESLFFDFSVEISNGMGGRREGYNLEVKWWHI